MFEVRDGWVDCSPTPLEGEEGTQPLRPSKPIEVVGREHNDTLEVDDCGCMVVRFRDNELAYGRCDQVAMWMRWGVEFES